MKHDDAVMLCESVGLEIEWRQLSGGRGLAQSVVVPDGMFTKPQVAALIVQHMQERTCDWMLADPDDDMWMGDCGIAFGFVDGGPEDNDMEFCPRCGGRLQVKEGEDD